MPRASSQRGKLSRSSVVRPPLASKKASSSDAAHAGKTSAARSPANVNLVASTPQGSGSGSAGAGAPQGPALTLEQLRSRVLAQWPAELLAWPSDGPEAAFESRATPAVGTTVEPLWLCSRPSPALQAADQADLRALFCRPPRLASPFHPARAPAFLGKLAGVRKIPQGTRVPDPYVLKNLKQSKGKKRAAGSDEAIGAGSSGSSKSSAVPLVPHPAAGQHGLFARAYIAPHTFLGPYLGVVHTEAESCEESNYDLRLWADRRKSDGRLLVSAAEAQAAEEEHQDDGEGSIREALGVDASQAGGLMRFVNDFRGILPRPNVFFQDWEDFAEDEGETEVPADAAVRTRVRGIGLFTGAHAVEPGTELCVSYGKGFWQARPP